MGTAVMKELSAQWLTALYDNFRGCPEIITNVFKEAEIVAALEDQEQSAELSDEDPFADLTRLVDRYFPLLQVTIPMCLIPYNTMCFIIHL